MVRLIKTEDATQEREVPTRWKEFKEVVEATSPREGQEGLYNLTWLAPALPKPMATVKPLKGKEELKEVTDVKGESPKIVIVETDKGDMIDAMDAFPL
ncbi:hypothetical protein ACLOJK_001741 [Asimina triloba]